MVRCTLTFDGIKESTSNTIIVEEFDVDTVKRMLDFLYSGDYSVTPNDAISNILLGGDTSTIEDSKSKWATKSTTVYRGRRFTFRSRK